MSMNTKINSIAELFQISTKIEEKNENLIVFPWTLRWLKGPEYFHILQNYEMYNTCLGFEILSQHPEWIYQKPQSKYLC